MTEATELAILKRREQRWHQLAEENRKAARDHYSQGNISTGTWHNLEAEKCDRLADITRQQINRLNDSPAVEANRLLETMLLGEAVDAVQWKPYDQDWSPTP